MVEDGWILFASIYPISPVNVTTLSDGLMSNEQLVDPDQLAEAPLMLSINASVTNIKPLPD